MSKKTVTKQKASYEKPLKINAKFKDVIKLAVGVPATPAPKNKASKKKN